MKITCCSWQYLWYSATAVLVVVGVGCIVSFITGANKPNEADPKLMIPLFDITFAFLPEKILKPLRFGEKYDVMIIEEKDIRHTADELPEGEVNVLFDIELQTKAENGNIANGNIQMNGEVIKAQGTLENEVDHSHSKQNNAYVAYSNLFTRL